MPIKYCEYLDIAKVKIGHNLIIVAAVVFLIEFPLFFSINLI